MDVEKSVLNFGAGPAKLPREVLEEVQRELLSYQNSGMSLMEMSHRGEEYSKINTDAQNAVRELLNVPSNYKILFMQGGGTGVFAAVPLNLMNKTGTADYVVTGSWSWRAAKEAEKFGEVKFVVPKLDKTGKIPAQQNWSLNTNASYVFYCDNDTVDGVEFPFIPETNGVPLVADMCSNIMTKKIDVSKFGVIFAGAQKNIGPAGVAVVIIRDDLLGNSMKYCPSILDFTYIDQANSIHNTPPTFSIYVMEKVFQWVIKNGGVTEMQRRCAVKSGLVYEVIDKSNSFYCSGVDKPVRSRINIPFRINGPNGDDKLESKFLEEAKQLNMFQLKGHKLVGGIRISLFNSISINDVMLLINFMKDFQNRFETK